MAAALLTGGAMLQGQAPRGGAPTPKDEAEGFRFKSGVELVNVTATVTDGRGRFVASLQKDDFVVYEDGQLQQVTHFSNERVPVSLGILLDTSGSMAGEKLSAARDALDRFLFDLLDPQDEIFLYQFSTEPELVQDWTTDRNRLSRALRGIGANGGTAMLDAVAEAVPYAQTGENRKKAVVIISDGNDTNSHIDLPELKQLIRETEVLVYAIGIDGPGEPAYSGPIPRRVPIPIPLPIPGRRGGWGLPPMGGGAPTGRPNIGSMGEGVNAGALRDITDDSGGRTELVRSARDLNPATANIADELSKQYYLGYTSTGKKDGRWHTIRVELRDRSLHIRARRGYVATP